MQHIAIHSVPRSGSTWLGNIFNSHPNLNFSYQPLFSYQFKGFLNAESSLENITTFFDNLISTTDEFVTQKEGIEKGIIPNFNKIEPYTHNCYKEVRYHHILRNMLEKDKKVKVIGLVRNPLSTIYSWYRAPKEFKAELGWDFLEEWQHAPKKNKNMPEEFNGYQKWKEVAMLFDVLKKDFPDRFYLIKYDDLLKNTKKEIEDLFNFVNLEVNEQTLNFLHNSTTQNKSDAYSVYKKKTTDDSWKNGLPKTIINYISNDLKDTSLSHYL